MPKSCFLFGHSDTPYSICPMLEQAIEQAVAEGITHFYVGYHGSFDHMASAALRTVKRRHPEISLVRLLAYHPSHSPVPVSQEFDGTLYPEGMEQVPQRLAIIKANQYMLCKADTVICYASPIGNAGRLLEYAKHQNQLRPLMITNLREKTPPPL